LAGDPVCGARVSGGGGCMNLITVEAVYDDILNKAQQCRGKICRTSQRAPAVQPREIYSM